MVNVTLHKVYRRLRASAALDGVIAQRSHVRNEARQSGVHEAQGGDQVRPSDERHACSGRKLRGPLLERVQCGLACEAKPVVGRREQSRRKTAER